MYYTTINKILNNNPCNPAKVKELAGNIDYDTQVSFKQIYYNVESQDAIWCIRTLDYDAEIQAFALRCARRVEHLDETGAAKKCNDTLERHLKGEATKEELDKAARAAWAASAAMAAWAASAARTASAASAASAARTAWDARTARAAWAARAARDAWDARAARDAWDAANVDILKQIEDDFLTTFCGE